METAIVIGLFREECLLKTVIVIKLFRKMISIGDSDWDSDSDDELVPIVTKPLTNGHTVPSNGYPEVDIRTQTQDFYTFEDLQCATTRGNLELVTEILTITCVTTFCLSTLNCLVRRS